jgi:hypothetical protein
MKYLALSLVFVVLVGCGGSNKVEPLKGEVTNSEALNSKKADEAAPKAPGRVE